MNKIKGLVCVGAPKCGTTLLFKGVSGTGQVNIPSKKELNFWNCQTNIPGADSPYIRSFPRFLQKLLKIFNRNDIFNYYESCDLSKWFVDFTPAYMTLEKRAIIEMHDFYDDLKIILCIRNPADRVESHFNYSLRLKRNFYLRFMKWWYYRFSKCRAATSYLHVFEKWREIVGEEKIIVICYEDLITHPKIISESLSAFMGVSIDIDVDEFINKTDYRSTFNSDLRSKVNLCYEEDVRFWSGNRCG